MIKKILLSILIFLVNTALADTIKTDVLVIGGGPGGTAAAVQCARSKVKTLLVEPGQWLGGAMTSGGICIIDANNDMPSGIWGEFRKKIVSFYSKTPGYDTTYNAKLRFEPFTAAAILKKLTDTVKNLTVKLNTPWTAVKKDGNGWEVTITLNNKPTTVKAQVLVDATDFGDVAAKAGVLLYTGTEGKQETGERLAPPNAENIIRDLTWAVILKDYGQGSDHTILKPEGYTPLPYACLKGKDIKKMLDDGKLPNEKYLISDCANTYPVAPEDLSPEKRDANFKAFRQRTLGMIYDLQTELGYKNLGLDEEYGSPDRLPYIPYIREYRRVKGQIRMVLDDVYNPYGRESKLYRTSIGVSSQKPDATSTGIKYGPFPPFSIPLGVVVAKDAQNLIVTEKAISVTHLVNAGVNNPAVEMVIGQGAGTVAAYCAFFKTTTEHLNVRIIQGELLDFKGYLLPLTDIPQTDRDFRAIQQVSATGLLQSFDQPEGKNSLRRIFAPDTAVRTVEVKPFLNEIYTRGFLWFNRTKPGEYFTVGNLLSFISEITLSDPKTFQMDMQKRWKTAYGFNKDFDINRPVTRREFASLTNKYLNPFARHVDITGKLIN